ncbi:MAG: ABC transporter substrate-binding protein [Phormidesmis sp.]
MMHAFTRRKFLQYGFAGLGTSVLLKGCRASTTGGTGSSDKPIVIGSIYDQTGGLSSLGVQQIACQELAIEEINAKGGLLGREVQVKLYDGQSDVQTSAQLAQKLILQDKVDVLMGCLSSAAREAVRPVVSKYGGLYFYPSQYEGGVCDKQTFLCGVTAAGIIDPMMRHAAEKMQAKQVYVIAADYNFGQISDKWVRYYGEQYGVSVTQSDFIPFDVSDFSTTISKIQQAAPDAVVSILVGDAHEGFFGQWANSGLKEQIPVLAASLSHPYNQDGSTRPEKADIIAVRSYWQEDPAPAIDFIGNSVNNRNRHPLS